MKPRRSAAGVRIAYAADPSVTERMLERMFIGDPPGNYDHILDVSTARTGITAAVDSRPALVIATPGSGIFSSNIRSNHFANSSYISFPPVRHVFSYKSLLLFLCSTF